MSYQTFNLYNTFKKEGREKASEIAHRYSNDIQARLEVAMDSARTLAYVLEAYGKSQAPDRSTVDEILKNVLKKNDHFLGVWTCWEPNAFDGKDDEFKNKKGHDETGRYIPYHVRNQSGEIIVEALIDYEKPGAGDYYLLALNSGDEQILEPYLYMVAGKETLITSLVVPITIDNKKVGVAGIDIVLDNLQDVASVSVYDTGYMSIISNSGLYVANPKDNSTIGKMSTETSPWINDYLENIKNGKPFTTQNFAKDIDAKAFRISVPIIVGHSKTPWTVLITIPVSKIMSELYFMIAIALLIGLFTLVLGIVSIKQLLKSNSQKRYYEQILDAIPNPISVTDSDMKWTFVNAAVENMIGVKRQGVVGHHCSEWNADICNTEKCGVAVLRKGGNSSVFQNSGDSKYYQTNISYIKDDKDRNIGHVETVIDVNDQKQLEKLVSKINRIVAQLASGAAQVSDSSQSLSQGATEQAASIEQITSSMTELSSQTKSNAENANITDDLLEKTKKVADKGNEHMQGMISAMQDISISSKEIGKIIKVIDDIAFQTNLLALNAAVEAARAGTQGKGFAVVAQEVRSLAGRSAKAAQETTALIEGAVSKVNKGTDIVNVTAQSLQEIVDSTSKVSKLVGEIAASSNEQAQGIAQINQGLSQIEKVTQQNTANAEETASAADELSGMTVQLKNLVSGTRADGGSDAGKTAERDVRPTPTPKKIAHRKSGTTDWGNIDKYEKDSEKLKPEDLISFDEDDFEKY